MIFKIEKRDFKLRWHFLSDVLMFSVGCLWFSLPPCVLILGYHILISGNYEHRMLGTGLAVFLVMAFIYTLPCLLIAVWEKNRLPVSMELSDKGIVLRDKQDRTWKVRYSDCRCATDFGHAFMANFFRGTWVQGITIYVPKDKLEGFPKGIYDTKDHPPDRAFHFPTNAGEKTEAVALLESRRCRLIPAVNLLRFFVAFWAPTVFLLIHVAGAWLLFREIAIRTDQPVSLYGIFGTSMLGLATGIAIASALVGRPLQKIDSLYAKRTVTFGMYGIIIFTIGLPIYLWNTPNAGDLRPDFFAAAFVTVLCFAESYLWKRCYLKHE